MTSEDGDAEGIDLSPFRLHTTVILGEFSKLANLQLRVDRVFEHK